MCMHTSCTYTHSAPLSNNAVSASIKHSRYFQLNIQCLVSTTVVKGCMHIMFDWSSVISTGISKVKESILHEIWNADTAFLCSGSAL